MDAVATRVPDQTQHELQRFAWGYRRLEVTILTNQPKYILLRMNYVEEGRLLEGRGCIGQDSLLLVISCIETFGVAPNGSLYITNGAKDLQVAGGFFYRGDEPAEIEMSPPCFDFEGNRRFKVRIRPLESSSWNP